MNKAKQQFDHLSPEEQRAEVARLLRKRLQKPKYAPLSFAQERLWILDQLTPGLTAYNMFTLLHLDGGLDAVALERSLNEVIHRHAVLRTAFATIDEQPRQVIAPTFELALPVVGLEELGRAEQAAEVERLARGAAQRPFDLAQGPLVRVTLLRLGAEAHALLVCLHHIVSDGWSMSILQREVMALYAAFAQGQPSPLPPLPIQYADYAVWQRDWLRGEVGAKLVAYWREQLQDAPRLNLPTDRPRPPLQTYRGARQSLALSAGLTQTLKAVSAQESATLFMTLLAAFEVLLYRYTGQDDLVVGIPIAGRTRPETENLIGFFINSLALRTRLTGAPSFREFVGRVREVTLGAYAHQDLPFEQVVESLQVERDLSRNPLFQVFFNMLNLADYHAELPGRVTEGGFLSENEVEAKFDLTVQVREQSGAVVFTWFYNVDLFEEATIAWMLECFQTLLESIAENPDQPISQLPLLTPARRQQWANQHNRTQPTNPFVEFRSEEIEQSIPARFEQQVKRQPGKVAIKTSRQSLTYAALNRHANRVARLIQARYDDRTRLSRQERTRYTRQMLLDGWGIEAQEALKSATVFVAGAGGSGSPLIMQLALCGVGTIIVCDDDEVELSNLNRQMLHDESRLGMNKAQSAQSSVRRINPHVNVVARTERITRENAWELVGESAILFDNVDDLEAKFILSECAVAKQIPHILSSMIDLNAYVVIFHPPQAPCFHCLYDRAKLGEVREIRGLLQERTRPNPVASPALFLSTGFACNEGLKILLGLGQPAYNRYFLFNQKGSKAVAGTYGYQKITYLFSDYFRKLCKEQGFDWTEGWRERWLEELVIERDPACPVCGENGKNQVSGTSWERIFIPPTDLKLASECAEGAPKHEQVVALLFGHEPEMVVGMLGALKAGKVYVPLDPTFPEARLARMLEDSEARLIITDGHNLTLAEKLRTKVNRRIGIINVAEAVTGVSDENPDERIEPGQPAYILYTSGSAGQPKGVVQSHRNVLHHIQSYTNGLHLSAQDGLTLLSTYGFDAAVMDIYGALFNGATLHLFAIREEGLVSLADRLGEGEITIYHSTPTIYRHFIESLSGKPNLGHVRLVVLGGEAVHKKDVDLYKQHFASECILVNLMGSTESSLNQLYFMNQQTVVTRYAVSLGYPVEDTLVQLLDQDGEVSDFYGEIGVKSRHVALGYWQNPELTQAAFLGVPGGDEPRLYRTGDLGRRLPDGSLEFVGRKDAQVKIRGIRIEPGEVEAALGEIDSVREAIVVACEYTGAREAERERGDLRLVAYVVTRPPRPSANELRGLLQKKLPEPMIPSAFVFLDALPLTPTGKVNRRALPEPSADNPEQEKTFEAPRTPVEEMVAGIWSQVLGLEQVGGQSAIGVHDNFFDLGGHSLLATQIVSRLGHVFQIELPLRELFDSPTVADLAKRIEAIRSLGQAHTAPVVAPLTRRAELARLLQRRLQKSKHAPLSFAQQRLWFLSQLEPHSIAYHLANATRITGPLNIKAIEQSVNAIIQRHGTLRTTFVAMEGQPVQVIAPSLTLALPVIDLSQLAATERETQVQRLAAAEAQRPFDLAAGPLLRCTLLRLAENEHVLLLTMHHIVSDGWSMGVFIREMVLLYQAFTNGQPSPLPELPIQYADYAAWQREWLQGEALEQQVTYWKHQLAGVPVLELPTDRPRPAKLTYQGTTLSFQLSESLKTALQALCRREGVTLFMTLLAGFQTLLSRYTGQVDIAVGSPIANRNRSEIEGLIGFFVNTLVLRANLSGHLTFRQLLGQVRGTTLEAYMHQDLPFERLVEALQPARDLGHQPLFQVMFILQNAPRSALELEGLTFSRLEMEGEASKFDLTLALTEMPQGLRGVVEYNTDLFEASTIVRLVGHFQTLLEGIVADSDRRLSDLPLLTEAEEHQLLVERNDTWADYPRNRCIHELIEDQVKQTPDAVALVFDPPASRGSSPNQHLTYQELDARANQLAHRLQELGVGPEVLTGVCMQRSAEMVVGLYGILKAGGAYVPLDPTFPPERLAFMLADAQVPVLLTQERLRESLPKFPGQVICLDEDEKNLSFAPQVVESRVDARHLAYVIYTSGSTGKPKGVQICHQAVVNFLEAMRQRPGFAASDTLLSVTTLSFDIAGLELYLPLSCGGRVVIARQEDVVNGARLAELIAENNVTVMQATPATWRLLIQSGWCGDERLSILCGGEAFPRELAQALVGRVKAVWNMYGPTETTVWSAIYPMQAGSGAVPIGQPVANTQIYLLDGHLKPVLVGVPGELYIGGEGVARGYLNHPDLTAERFIPNPYARMRTDGGTPGARPENFTLYPSALRLYRTGDLARYLPDGNLEFLGRLDHQVKVRGFRIELGEIEATLAQHPAIREAVVVARDTEHDLGNQQLVAYLVPRENTPSVNELRRFLQDKLPAYMVPSAFVALDALPLTPSGKVNRRALPAPDLARPELDTTYAAPRNPTEEMLAGIWSQVLHLERVGIHDNFFDLGGHSLLATQVMSRVRDIFLVELPLRTLFESPTVAGLSEHIEVPGREECGLSALRLQSDVSENRPAVGVDQMSDQEVSVLLGKLLG